jgi:hypothetical protein
MSENLKIKLLEIACGTVHQGYNPLNKKIDGTRDVSPQLYNPENIFEVYKEVLQRFKDVDKQEE